MTGTCPRVWPSHHLSPKGGRTLWSAFPSNNESEVNEKARRFLCKTSSCFLQRFSARKYRRQMTESLHCLFLFLLRREVVGEISRRSVRKSVNTKDTCLFSIMKKSLFYPGEKTANTPRVRKSFTLVC